MLRRAQQRSSRQFSLYYSSRQVRILIAIYILTSSYLRIVPSSEALTYGDFIFMHVCAPIDAREMYTRDTHVHHIKK